MARVWQTGSTETPPLARLGRAIRPFVGPVTAAAALFAFILIAASVWIAGRERDADDAVAHTVRNEARLATVQSLLQDAELGQRGYLLTGDTFYLDPYTRAVEAIGGELDLLEAGVDDDPRQTGNLSVLRALAAQKLSELRQTVDRRRGGDEAGAVAVLRSGQGKILMDGIRDVLGHMRSEEEENMTVRAEQARRSAFRMEATIMALALLSAVLAAVALRGTLRRARSAEASRDELLARLDRKLMAVLAADVVGYSRLMEGDEALTLSRLTAIRDRVDPLIAQHGGAIVTTAGDSILAAFGSALAAVDCAVAIQTHLARKDEASGLTLRIGINVGDVIQQGGDIFGDTVNVASRLESLAEPGGICVSRAVRDHVAKQRRFAFDDLGPQEVKNIAEPVSTFRIRLGDLGGPGAATLSDKAVTTGP